MSEIREPQRLIRMDEAVRLRMQFDYFVAAGAGSSLAYADTIV